MRIYLVDPKNADNFWTVQSSVAAVGCKTLMPNCALATLVALTPGDADVEYVYCDENASSIDQILTELENARAAGAEAIFFSEDNFFAKPSFTKDRLTEIVRWNTSIPSPLSFYAQSTLSIAEDEEILRLLADARFSAIFLGVESTRRECLDEVNKGRVVRPNAKEFIRALSRYGIVPFLGLIVGFDHDDESTFGEFEDFLEETASPLVSTSFLLAPVNTPLYKRIEEEGRLREDFDGLWHFSTNIVPVGMSLQRLIQGNRDLLTRLYAPEEFERRTLRSSWRINPRLVKKAVIVMMYYWNFFDFVKEMSQQDVEDPRTRA